jgi:hypothetical protein
MKVAVCECPGIYFRALGYKLERLQNNHASSISMAFDLFSRLRYWGENTLPLFLYVDGVARPIFCRVRYVAVSKLRLKLEEWTTALAVSKHFCARGRAVVEFEKANFVFKLSFCGDRTSFAANDVPGDGNIPAPLTKGFVVRSSLRQCLERASVFYA